MKKVILILINLYSLSSAAFPEIIPQSHLIVTTFNVHYISSRQTSMIWDERKEAVLKAVLESRSDIIGFQEMETFEGGHLNFENKQLNYLLDNLPEYRATAFGKADSYPITQPLLYKPDLYTVLDQGFFFFSDTPDVIYSRTFNGSYPAFCTWVKFHDLRRDREFYIYNMHNDFKSRGNRIKSSRLILERMSAQLENEEPVILMGDFNALSSFKPVSMFNDAGLITAETRGSSFHFNRGWNIFPAIDHILYSVHFNQTGSFINRKKYLTYPSDHYPVSVGLNWIE